MHGAVIGAGIAGIACTQALRRRGIEVDLLEAADEARSTGYQLNVLANGMYALSKIGLLDALIDSGYGAPLRSAPIFDGLTGRLVRTFPVVGVGSEVAPRSYYRGDLHRALLDGLQGPPPECARAVATIIDEPDADRVVVRFESDAAREYDFVVGADGAYSRTRGALFPEHRGYVPRFDGLLFAVHADLEAEGPAERLFAAQLREGAFVQFGAPGSAVVLSCAGGSRFGVIVGLLDRPSGREIATPEEARALAHARVGHLADPRIPYVLEHAFWEPGNPLLWRVGDIDPLPYYHAGRVALVGDAAHAMIPVVGQGANQSFEDAMVLAAELDAARSEAEPRTAIERALARYSAHRQPHVTRIQREARRRLGAMVARSPFAHRLGNAILRRLPQRLFDRFERHVLEYAIRDPACSIGRGEA